MHLAALNLVWYVSVSVGDQLESWAKLWEKERTEMKMRFWKNDIGLYLMFYHLEGAFI